MGDSNIQCKIDLNHTNHKIKVCDRDLLHIPTILLECMIDDLNYAQSFQNHLIGSASYKVGGRFMTEVECFVSVRVIQSVSNLFSVVSQIPLNLMTFE